MPPVLVTASTAIQTAIFAVLLLKLFRADLARVYVAFTALVIFEPVRILFSALIPRASTAYGWYYVLTQPVVWLLYALVTLEIYKSVFRSLTGISKLTRYVILSATGLAVAASALTLALQPDAAPQFRTLSVYFALESTIFLSLLTFVLILVVFLAWYPVPVHKNAVVYCGVFALYFGTKTAALLLRTLGGPEFVTAASLAGIAASAVSGVLWIALLTQVGETRRAKPIHQISPAEEARLLATLQSFNDSLLRSVPDRT